LQRQYYDGKSWSDTPGKQVLKTKGVIWMSNDMVNLLANLMTISLSFLLIYW